MDVDNKRLYFWLPWFIVFAITALFLVLLRNELARLDRGWQERLSLYQTTLEQTRQLSERDALRQASLLAQLLAQDPDLVKLVRQARADHDREGGNGGAEQSAQLRLQLNQHLQSWWARMTTLGVRELNVYLGPSATVFLRVSRPDRFGDDLSQMSVLVTASMNSGVLSSGMEVGHFGAAYRAVAPVLDKPQLPPLGAIEVGMSIVGEAAPNQGQALLLHSSLVNEVLWGSVRQDVQSNSNNVHTQWGIETFNNPLIKSWQTKGILPSVMLDDGVPWILQDQNRTWLMSVAGLGSASDPRMPKVAPKVFLLNWSDITSERARYLGERQQLYARYLVGWLIALAALWLLFRYNQRLVYQLLNDHSEQLQQERDSSEQSRQRLTLALVSSESGFWEWNITNNRAVFSAEWRALCGLPADDGRADIEEWLSRVHPSDKRASYTEMIRHIKGETPMFENEYRLRIADGSYKWIFTRGKVVEWQSDGKAALMLGVYTDITDRKKNEIIVIRQQAALRALNEIASIPVVDAEDQLRRALAIGSRYLGLPSGAVSRVQGHQYQIKVKIGGSGYEPGMVDALSNYFCELTLGREDVFAQDDISLCSHANHVAHLQGRVESYIGVPIWLKGQIYGTLYFASERSRHQAYDDLDCDFMRLLARWVGVTLERWQHQSEQQALLDRFAKLCDQLPGFLYQFQLFPDGTSTCPYASAGIEDLYSVTPEEVMESADKLFDRLHRDDLGWISQTVSQSAKTLTPWIASFRVLHPKRGEIWVHAESRPERLPDNSVLWHGFIVDITENKRAELRLQEINALREAIFDAASIAIISTDPRGLIKTFNKGAEDLLGYAADEVIDILTPLPFHLHEELATRGQKLAADFGDLHLGRGFELLIARAREGDEDENEWTWLRKDNITVPIILSVTALRSSDGEITGYLLLGRDISEIKRIDRLKSEFISTVSHELRTPLTAISGALGIIVNGAAGALPDTANKMLNIAHKNSLRLIHLVNDLLDMEKLVAGKMYFDVKPQSLLFLVQQSLEQNATYAAQFQVKFVLRNLIGEDVKVNVDTHRLQQVLANFLSNAAKFSPQGEQVDICLERLQKAVRVSVIDRGPGIAEDFRGRIFEKFSQADSSDTRQKGGTGLGLAICKEIIERMGGRIGFNSEVGLGAQFYFEMPVEDVQPTQEKSEQRYHHQTGNRLLVIEDDPEVAELLATILRSNNYRVDMAATGEAALERIALYAYQLITVDLKLPDTDGLQLIRQLRSDASTQRLPIIVISANLDAEEFSSRNDPWFAGIQWLQKPQTAESIIAAVKRALDNETSPEIR
jgi:PAS domain S-box-containing protein